MKEMEGDDLGYNNIIKNKTYNENIIKKYKNGDVSGGEIANNKKGSLNELFGQLMTDPGMNDKEFRDTLRMITESHKESSSTMYGLNTNVKVKVEKRPDGVNLDDFLDENVPPEEESQNTVAGITKITRMQAGTLIQEIKVSFEDKEIEEEVDKMIKMVFNCQKLDFYKEDFEIFIKKFDELFDKLKCNKTCSDYIKINALNVFFMNIKKIYEYLSLTIFDIIKSKNKEDFDKNLILNTIKRKLELDVTKSEHEDLLNVFNLLIKHITTSTTNIVDLIFDSIKDNKKLSSQLLEEYPNLNYISEISRLINNEKTINSESANGVINEITEDNFEQEVMNEDVPVIVEFYSPNCTICKKIQPKLEQLAQEYNGKIKFVKVDVSKPTSFAGKYNFSGTPTVIAFNKGNTHGDKLTGAKSKGEYETLIKSVQSAFENDPTNEGNLFPKPNLDGKDYIINGVDFSDPKSIIEYLDIYATGQEHAKGVLALAFSRFIVDGIITSQLIVGPSGCGKTYMTTLLCNLTGLKFINIGISNLTSAGIKGANLKEQLDPLVGHKGKAILFLDEIDKLADSNNHNGAQLQNELLSLFNTETPTQEYEGIDLKNILILGAGAFENNGTGKSLYNMLKKKAGNKPNVFEMLDDGDLIDYGLKPEIVGRLTGKTYLNALTPEQLYEMLTKKGSEVSKLTSEYEKHYIELVFTDEALLEIARTAYNGVGARAIKSILEKIMKPIGVRKTELAGKTVEINKALVEEVLETANSAEKEIDWKNTKTIIAYLDRFVPGNKNAKTALANSFKEFIVNGKLSHTFIYGESGSGKTYMVSLLCKAAGIQFGEGSLANITAEGFVGTSLSDILKSSFSKGYMGKSGKKVLFLDEIDKLLNKIGLHGGGNFGEDLTNELLSIFNGTSETGIDLSNCLIISAGACAGNRDGESLKALVQKRIGGQTKLTDNSLLEQVEKEDLEAYGFKNELVGRFKRISFLESIDKEYLRKVMTESEGSIYKKKMIEAQMEGYNITFSDESIEFILDESADMRTGVRALETVLNRLFDKIYDVYSKGDIPIDYDFTVKALTPRVKFENPEVDKIDWTSAKTVKAYLDTKAQGNEIYKRNLALMFWKLKKKIDSGEENIKIPNLLVLGPSGGGKTYLLKLIAPILGIPFVETNIARIESNINRERIGDVFRQVGEKVKTAIVFIDEIDKILMNPGHPLNNELMSYIEGGNYEGRDLKGYVFVGAGAFQGYNVTDDDGNVSLKSLQSIGVKPEVIGRFGNICGIEKMNTKKMMSILNSENSAFLTRLKSIQDEYGLEIKLEEGVLEYICEVAINQPTGARALELITNYIFTGLEFNISDYIGEPSMTLTLDFVKEHLTSL